MFNGLWPAFDEAEVPISVDHQRRARAHLGRPRGVRAGRQAHGADVDSDDADAFWAAVDKITGTELWSVKRRLREQLVEDARARLGQSWRKRGARRGRARLDRHARSTPTC